VIKTLPIINRPIAFGGFTLIEAMVAMVIASVVIGTATSSWLSVLRTHQQLEDRSDVVQGLQVAQRRLGDDMACALDVPQITDHQVSIVTRDGLGNYGRCTWTLAPRLIRRWVPETGQPREETWSRVGLSGTAALFENRGLRLFWHLGVEASTDRRPLTTVMFPLVKVQGGD